jgi:hypothetical protein
MKSMYEVATVGGLVIGFVKSVHINTSTSVFRPPYVQKKLDRLLDLCYSL